MVFTSTPIESQPHVVGDRKSNYGTYVNDSGSTGGDIDTGMKVCQTLILQPVGAAVGANVPKVNETFPADGDAVTIVTDADESGIWIAQGY